MIEQCPRYAEILQRDHQALERHGFVDAVVMVAREQGLPPVAALVRLARRFGCEIYFHKEGFPHHNVRFHGKPYLNVRSILSALSLRLVPGDRLEFRVSGVRAEQAVRQLDAAVNTGHPENPLWSL